MSEVESDFGYLAHEIGKAVDDHVVYLAGGSCKDYAEYQKICGRIDGLKSAQRYLLEHDKKLREGNDD